MHFGLINRENFEKLTHPAQLAAALEQRYPDKLILVRCPELVGAARTTFPSDPACRAIAEEFDQAIDSGPSLSGLMEGEIDC